LGVNIPAPKMQDEIENRKAIAKKAKMLGEVLHSIASIVTRE
jgi:hypothetical protein